jgi:hypothetical protein
MARLLRHVPVLGRRLAARTGLDRDEGTATIEFVIWFPLFFIIMLSSIESGVLMLRYMMLERSLDIAVRHVRLSTGQEITHDDVRDEICEFALLLDDCRNNLILELTRIPSDTWTFPAATANCVNRIEEIEPVISFTPGNDNDIMMVRACVNVNILFNQWGLGGILANYSELDRFQLVAASAFANEPR